ncbi:MAG: DUF4197 domain-containing protein [Verrucomicrobiales bacterium]
MKQLILVAVLSFSMSALHAAESTSTPPAEPEKKKGFGALFESILKRTTTNTGSSTTNTASQINLGNLTSDQVAAGIKEALAVGLQKAVATLGQTNGFLTNSAVTIPLPSQLKVVNDGLQRLNQGAIVDQFVATMNHAAEQAVPIAASVFSESLRKMSVEDAVALLQSKSKTAATEYFQKTCSAELTDKLMPIIKDATEQVGVTAAYKKVMDKASFGTKFLANSSLNLDRYVTGKSLEGLFKMVGEEEKKIRENPQARATDLLKDVFGVLNSQTNGASATTPAK